MIDVFIDGLQGNFGEVFRGTLGTTPVALKSIKDETRQQEIIREAAVLTKLRHPSIESISGV